jgi:hypothetical protein
MFTPGETILESVRLVVLSRNGSAIIFSFAFCRSGFRVAPALIALCAVAFPVSYARAATPVTSAAPTAAPIAIADGCSYKTVFSGMGFGGPVTVNGKGYNFFTVKFTNGAPVAATKIVFQIDFGKASRIVIPDVGTFAPGETIQQTFRDKGKDMTFAARPTPNDGSVICTVLSAQFADGTTFVSPLATMASPAP